MIYFIRHNMLIMSMVFILIAFLFYITSPKEISSNTTYLLKGTFFLDNVIIYIAALEILKNSLNKSKFLVHYQYHPNLFSYHQHRLLAMISAFSFGLGVSSFLNGLSVGKINTKPISEGMTASMFIYPTTLASGFVFDSLGLTSLSIQFLLGLPLLLLILLPFPIDSFSVLAKSNFFRLILFLGLCNYIYLIALSGFIQNNHILKQAAFFVFLSLIINHKSLLQIPRVLWMTRNSFIFFICVGMLGYSFIGWIEQFTQMNALPWLNSYLALAIPIFAIPLLSILFIHPLVLFIIFSPLLSPYMQSTGFSEQTIYVVWVTMLVNAQLLSPVSLTTVLSIANTDSNIFTESFLKHSVYSLKVSCLAYCYFIIILNWG